MKVADPLREDRNRGYKINWEKAFHAALNISPEAAKRFVGQYKRPLNREEDDEFRKRYRWLR
jgi:hypothetical protein